MMSEDFAERTRTRIAEARAVLTKLRGVYNAAIQQLARLDKQHSADRNRVYNKIGELADGVVGELPDEATDDDIDQATVLQAAVNDFAADVAEIHLAFELDDLKSVLSVTNGIFTGLKETESQLLQMARRGVKLGI